MIKPEQIPEEVIAAYIDAAMKQGLSFRGSIAAALNAWPGMHVGPAPADARRRSIILPLPKETSNE